MGGQSASVAYAGRTSCCSGIDQINFAVPGNAPSGCYVPVVVRLAGTVVSNTVTMAIDPKGAPCTDPANSLSAIFRAGGKSGTALLEHDNVALSVGGTIQSVTADSGTVSLRQETGGAWAFDPYVSLPPLGTCSAYGIAGDYPALNNPPGIAPSVRDLDGGAMLTVTSPAGSVSLPRGTISPVFYAALLASSEDLPGILSSYFSPWSFQHGRRDRRSGCRTVSSHGYGGSAVQLD